MSNPKNTNSAINLGIFSEQKTLFGMPMRVALLGLLFTGVTVFLLSVLAGLIIGMSYFLMMTRIHEHDPAAFDVWRLSLTNSATLVEGSSTKTVSLLVIDKE